MQKLCAAPSAAVIARHSPSRRGPYSPKWQDRSLSGLVLPHIKTLWQQSANAFILFCCLFVFFFKYETTRNLNCLSILQGSPEKSWRKESSTINLGKWELHVTDLWLLNELRLAARLKKFTATRWLTHGVSFWYLPLFICKSCNVCTLRCRY